MSARIRRHIRSNVVGYLSLFVALSGTAYAIDGPLPGQNQVGSSDIINGEVKALDLGGNAVRSGRYSTTRSSERTSLPARSRPPKSSTAPSAPPTSRATRSATRRSLRTRSTPRSSTPGFFYGIADNSIQSQRGQRQQPLRRRHRRVHARPEPRRRLRGEQRHRVWTDDHIEGHRQPDEPAERQPRRRHVGRPRRGRDLQQRRRRDERGMRDLDRQHTPRVRLRGRGGDPRRQR